MDNIEENAWLERVSNQTQKAVATHFSHKENVKMKTKGIMALALAAMFALTLTGEAMARGGGSGSVSGKGQCVRSQTSTSAQGSVNRPEDSQRRDGTFQSTGTTANGSTTRPDKGKGVRDGSKLDTTTATE